MIRKTFTEYLIEEYSTDIEITEASKNKNWTYNIPAEGRNADGFPTYETLEEYTASQIRKIFLAEMAARGWQLIKTNRTQTNVGRGQAAGADNVFVFTKNDPKRPGLTFEVEFLRSNSWNTDRGEVGSYRMWYVDPKYADELGERTNGYLATPTNFNELDKAGKILRLGRTKSWRDQGFEEYAPDFHFAHACARALDD